MERAALNRDEWQHQCDRIRACRRSISSGAPRSAHALTRDGGLTQWRPCTGIFFESWLVGAAIVVAFPWDVVAQNASPTFAKDIAPILQAKCQGCHRSRRDGANAMTHLSGGAALGTVDQEQSLTTGNAALVDRPDDWHSKDSRPTPRRAMRKSTAFVSVGHDGGAREGDSADMPPARAFPESQGWNIRPAADLVADRRGTVQDVRRTGFRLVVDVHG